MKVKFNIIIFFLFCFFVVYGCSSPNSEKADTNTSFNIVIQNIDIQHNKAVKNGTLVTGKVVLPKNINNEQIKPVSLALLEKLKKEYPDCEWFIIWMSDDDRMYDAANYIAMAQYKYGAVTVQGGIPSDKEIEEYNLKADNEGIIIKPSEHGINIYCEFIKIKQEAIKKGSYLSDDEIYPILSKKINLPEEEIKKVHRGIGRYYILKFYNIL